MSSLKCWHGNPLSECSDCESENVTDDPRHCDQCVISTYWYSSPGNIRPIRETTDRCPRCALWVCKECFEDDHIWCNGPDDMVYDLGYVCRMRKAGKDEKAQEYLDDLQAEMANGVWPAKK